MLVTPVPSDSNRPEAVVGTWFEQGSLQPEVREPALDLQRQQIQYFRDLRALLSFGTTKLLTPFTFNLPDGKSFTAPSAGLEGFLYMTERLQAQGYTDGELADQNGSFRTYLHHLLEASPLFDAKQLLTRVNEIFAAPHISEDQFRNLVSAVEVTVDRLRIVMKEEPSGWMKSAGIYQIFPRAFNLPDFRRFYGLPEGQSTGRFFADVNREDIQQMKKLGLNTIWPMGIFPIGERFRQGEKGSPFSIQNHETINPELGEEADFVRFVGLAHEEGLKVILDFVPNHTSCDSKLLKEHPEFFVQMPVGEGEPPHGYFEHVSEITGEKHWISHAGYWVNTGSDPREGYRDYWLDVAQLDYSNPELRRYMIDTALNLVQKFAVDGFRVDMAYQMFREYLKRNWGDDLQQRIPEREFISEFTFALKSEFPHLSIVAESYDLWDAHSRAGIDGLYGKCDIGRPGGHTGWYDALVSRDPQRIRAAIERAAFLHWQAGGMAMVGFTCNHDEAAPQRKFAGDWLTGATALTYLLPSTVLFYGGMEVGHDKPNLETPFFKPISFSKPSDIDWSGGDHDLHERYQRVFQHRKLIQTSFTDPAIVPLTFEEGSALVGYSLVETLPDGTFSRVHVIANTGDRPQAIGIGTVTGTEAPDILQVAPGEYELIVQ